MTKDDKDLEMSLSAFEVPRDLAPVVQALIDVFTDEDLELVEKKEQLEVEDTQARARQTYVASYLRLLHYFVKDPRSTSEEQTKARLALAYIKHAEQTGLDAAKFGKSLGDAKLQEEVASLRARLRETSRAFARAEQSAEEKEDVNEEDDGVGDS